MDHVTKMYEWATTNLLSITFSFLAWEIDINTVLTGAGVLALMFYNVMRGLKVGQDMYVTYLNRKTTDESELENANTQDEQKA